MIREYRESDRAEVERIGAYLGGSFNLSKLNSSEKIVVLEEDEAVKGFLVYSVLYEVADITYIVVDEKYRRCGYAGKMLEYLISSESIERVMLEVRVSNRNAIQLYEKYGFVTVRTIRGYYSNGEDAIVMERRI